jgi:hypothetical protein
MEDFRHIIPFFIPIIAIVMGIGIGMLGLWLDYQKKTRMFELHHKERLMAIERGMEVPPLPPEFFLNGRRDTGSSPGANSLRWGLIWLLLGGALGVAIGVNAGLEAASWALLPIAVGLAQIIFYLFAVSAAKAAPQQDSSATGGTSQQS